MKTVPSVVASTSAVAASALGLAFVREQVPSEPLIRREQEETGQSQQRSVSAPFFDMTSTATFTVSPFSTFAPSPRSFTFSSPSPITPNASRPQFSSSGEHTPSPGYDIGFGDGKRSLKRRLQARDTTTNAAVPTHMDELAGPAQVTQAAQTSQTSWSKRLSTFSSHDGSLASSPRPPSTAVSQSNGSVAFSNAGSTTPMFPSFSPASVPPNKLVKRASSIRSTKGSSRIPIPTFKRPATSHDRDATLQELQRRPSTAASSLPLDMTPQANSGFRWKAYFTPTLSFDNSLPMTPRRGSTSIPNPIKRVQPDRKYQPVLVSTREDIRPISIDFDVESRDESLPSLPSMTSRRPSMSLRVGRRFFSSPLPQRPSTASSNTSASLSKQSRSAGSQANSGANGSNRNSMLSLNKGDLPNSSPLTSMRSFSPIDLMPPQLPKWKRPSKSRPSEAKFRRKGSRSGLNSDTPLSGQANNGLVEVERPAKRRDTTGSSAPSHEDPVQPPAPPLSDPAAARAASPGLTKTLRAFSSNASTDLRSSYVEHGSSYPEAYALSSPAAGSTRARPARLSTAFSEASTFAGSDSDARYHDDDGLESPNEAFFDSVRTRATSAGSVNPRGPRIDAIFDESRTPQPENSPQSLNLFHTAKFAKEPFERPRHSVIEEEESVSTPIRSTHHSSAHASPETFRFGSSPTRQLGSSPPEVPFLFRRRAPDEVGLGIDDDVDMWDFGEGDKLPRWHIDDGSFSNTQDLHPGYPTSNQNAGSLTTPSKSLLDQTTDARSNIFDWSEQQLEKSPAGRSPPRPRTVHGKKDAETRGSRSVGRRAPSGAHVRSQSVPVVPESDSKRSQVITNKFGTWGVGSKGVTEDWNDDFDFDEPVPAIPLEYQQSVEHGTSITTQQTTKPRTPSGSMRVPQAIQEHQGVIRTEIGLVRDWGLLIEELKELRLRATSLHLANLDGDKMWEEVDAMIDLADQNSNDQTLAPRTSPPSSPTFDMSAFDEPAPPIFARNSPRAAPKLHAEDIFDSPSPSPARKTTAEHSSPRRPRKDSEAVAKSVIEALQQRRNASETNGSISESTTKKVPFDTATLRRLFPFVQELRDKAKKSIRDAEGLYHSPVLDRGEGPSLGSMFQDTSGSPPLHREDNASRGLPDESPSLYREDNASRSPPDELSRRMELMTVG